MFGSLILEVAIGLMFACVLVIVICFAVREGIENCRRTRAAFVGRACARCSTAGKR